MLLHLKGTIKQHLTQFEFLNFSRGRHGHRVQRNQALGNAVAPETGAPAQRKMRSVGTLLPDSMTALARSIKKGVEAMVNVMPYSLINYNALRAVPHILQHGAGLQHDGHHHAVQKSCLMRYRRGGQSDICRA